MGRIAHDHKELKVDYRAFNETARWEPFYGEVEEEMPPKMPKPLGRLVSIHAFVGANHADNPIHENKNYGCCSGIRELAGMYHNQTNVGSS